MGPKYYLTVEKSMLFDYSFLSFEELNSDFNRSIRTLFRRDFHERLLAYARVKFHINSILDEMEKEIERVREERASNYFKVLDSLTDSDEDLEMREFLNYQQSSFMSEVRNRYDALDLEREVTNKGLLISIYSLLEDSLLKFTDLFKEQRGITLTFAEVCKRDRGVFKYIKFLEVACDVDLQEFKNSKPYQEVCRWNRVRNQFVHVGDVVKEENRELLTDVEKLNILISDLNIYLSSENIDQLLNVIDEFLSIIVAESSKVIATDLKRE
nr:hypothetical protein [Paenibacillus xylanexedens]